MCTKNDFVWKMRGVALGFLTFVFIVGSLVFLKLDISKRNKAEEADGIERKSLALMGSFLGLATGSLISLTLWCVGYNNPVFMGAGMMLGVFVGSRINTANDRINPATYKKIKRISVFALIAVIFGCVGAAYIRIIPLKDHIEAGNVPESKFVYSQDNYYACQSGEDCSGYSTAYILREHGIEADGSAVYKGMDTFFGRVALHNVVDELKEYDIKSKAYHGNIATLKSRINEGKPVIALVTITLGTHTGLHYVVVVGYDSEYIYLADSTKSKTNNYDKQQYNRKVTYKEFEELWKTNIYPVNNIYIVVN